MKFGDNLLAATQISQRPIIKHIVVMANFSILSNPFNSQTLF